MPTEENNYTKEVDFKKWCPSCEYYNKNETDDPCNECLTVPARYGSAKPIKYWNKDYD